MFYGGRGKCFGQDPAGLDMRKPEIIKGYRVVLTADRLLTAGIRMLFDGMVLGSQTTIPFWPLACRLLASPRRARLPFADVAPLGLRRIEAALFRAGFSEDDVVLAHPDGLADVIGSRTRIVAISSGEPLGIGMNSATMSAIAGGEIVSARLFRQTLARARTLTAQVAPDAVIVAGGAGAWQLAQNETARQAFGIAHAITGYADGNAGEIFRDLLEGRPRPPVIAGCGADAESMPPIRGASAMGAIEIGRGCGWGCAFCSMARIPMRDIPEHVILADARVNAAAGQRDLAILSEDLFRYGAESARLQPEKLIALLDRLRAIDGVRLIQVDHANIASIAQVSESDLRAVRARLVGETGWRAPWINVGVESASTRLLLEHGCRAKLGPVADTWPAAAAKQMRRLCDAGFFPLASLVMGLPGETDEDVARTSDWVRTVEDLPMGVFPVFHAPLEPGATAPVPSAAHWRLIRQCYRQNFREVPGMVWNSQSAAGVGLPLRLTLQALGRAQALLWRARFAHGLRATA